MSGFNSSADGDFDRVFMNSSEFFDQFVGEQLWTCGYNLSGQLGDNNFVDRSSPGTVAGGGTNWKYVAVQSIGVTAAIKTDGTLWAWGNNQKGSVGDGTTTVRRSPVTTAGGGTNWKYVASGVGQYSGDSSVGAIKTDGTLWVWGDNINGQLGTNNTSSYSSPVTIVGGGTNWKQVSFGNFNAAAVKTDGTLWTWGKNNYGQLGDGTTSDRSSPVTVAGGGTNWKQVACGGSLNSWITAAIKTDGTLWGWGSGNNFWAGFTTTSSPKTILGGGTNWKQIAIGNSMISAIKTDGTLWTWGISYNGGLGDGAVTARSSPGTVSGGGTNWKQVAVGNNCAAAIKTDGTLWTWGWNQYGQLGDGTTSNRSSPVTTVADGINWKQVGIRTHTAAIGY